VRGHVGARLVDDADHPERNAHPPDLDSRGLLVQLGDVPDRVGEPCDLLEAHGHLLDRPLRQREPVEEGRVLAPCARRGHVRGVLRDQLLHVAPHRLGGEEERAVLRVRVRARDVARRGPRALPGLEHVGLDVGRGVHGANLTPQGRAASWTCAISGQSASVSIPVNPLDYSRYARALVSARPALAEEIDRAEETGWSRDAMEAFLQYGADHGEPHARLRELRQRVMLRTMARDLAGAADLAEVCGTMSALAEVAIAEALAFLEQGSAKPKLTVVGMGKLGGGELNV